MNWRVEMLFYFFTLWTSLIFLIIPHTSLAAMSLNPEIARKLAWEKNKQIQIIRFNSQKSRLALGQAQAVFDPQFFASASYQKSRTDSFSKFSNEQDRTTAWKLGLRKKFFTGTALDLSFTKLKLKSELNPTFINLGTPPVQFENKLEFSLQQPLLRNFFGYVDRGKEKSAKYDIKIAELNKEESIEELLLTTTRLFWQTYMSNQRLKNATSAYNKYVQLVRTLRKKEKLGIATKADLYRARAVLESQNRNLEIARFAYRKNSKELLLFLNIPQEKINFDVKEELPPLDKKNTPKNKKAVESAKLRLEQAMLERDFTQQNTLPTLNLVAKYQRNGVHSVAKEAYREVTDNENPSHSIGLEFTWPFASNLHKSQRAFKEIQVQEAQTNLLDVEEKKIKALEINLLKIKHLYAGAKAAIEEAKLRSRVVQAEEKDFQMGKIDSSQLIQDYNALYMSRTEKSQSIVNYKIALVELAAERDELISTVWKK